MSRPRVAALVLAAGMSKRMGPVNKLLADLGGEVMVRQVVKVMLASAIDLVVVVTGHQKEEVGTALKGLAIELVYNPQFEEGLASSLRCGLAALPSDVEKALIALGDMPKITTGHIDLLLAASGDDDIVIPVFEHQRGNPVLFSRCFF